MTGGSSGLGSTKHGKSGRANKNLTGKTGGKRTRRKGKTRKQRYAIRGSHVNKYDRVDEKGEKP